MPFTAWKHEERNRHRKMYLVNFKGLCDSCRISVKFSFSGKATKIWKNLPLVLTPRYWVKTAVSSKQVGDFFQILWPSHNVLTLHRHYYYIGMFLWNMSIETLDLPKLNCYLTKSLVFKCTYFLFKLFYWYHKGGEHYF